MERVRMEAGNRKTQLLVTAYQIAKELGIRKVTRAEVGRRCEVSDGLLNRYFAGREGLRFEVMEHAVTVNDAATLAACAAHYYLPSMPRALAESVKALQRVGYDE